MGSVHGITAVLALVYAGVMPAHAGQPGKDDKDDHMTKIKTDRILFLGNSITWHRPKAEIGWTDDWGMAASAQEKDYVHLVIGRLAGAMGRKPEAMIESVVDLEREYHRFDLSPLIRKCRDFKPDVVVLAMGENVPALKTEADRAGFKTAVSKLLNGIKKDSNPAIFVRSCFWPEPIRDGILKEVCTGVGGVFVDIGALGRDESNFARSERKFQHDGVAKHPGDKGMKAIADAIWSAIGARAGFAADTGK